MLLLYMSAPIAISRLRVLINPNCDVGGGEGGRGTAERAEWRRTISLGHHGSFSSIFAIRERDTIAMDGRRTCHACLNPFNTESSVFRVLL